MNVFSKLTLDNYLAISTFLFMVVGGIFALIQWSSTIKVRRSEFLDKILNRLIFDKEILEAMNIIDYDFIKYKWFNKSFYGSKLEIKIDKYLSFINYILYLHDLENISDYEFNVIETEINRIFISRQVQQYLWNLYHFGKFDKENCPYIRIINHGLNNGCFNKEFKLNNCLFPKITPLEREETRENDNFNDNNPQSKVKRLCKLWRWGRR